MKRIISLILVACLALNMAFAIDFTDLNEAAWAEDYIKKIADLGIVAGYADGTYKPLDKVTSYVAVVVMYRTINSLGLLNASEIQATKDKYTSVLVQYAVPQWPDLHEAVAFFLDKGIFTINELSGFMTGTKHNAISKQDYSRYYGKVLNLFLKDDINQLIKYSPKDVNQIDFESLKYINILYKRSIISGDDQGNFNPSQTLNRAILAKLMATGIDVLEAEKVTEETKVSGSIMALLENKKVAVLIDEANSKSIVETLDDTVDIKVGDQVGTYSDLTVNDAIVLVYKGNKLTEVQVPFSMKQVVEHEVEITSTSLFNGKQYMYTKLVDTEEIKFYELSSQVVITKEGVNATFDAIQKGDKAVIGLLGNVVVTVNFDSKFKSYTGTFKGIKVDGEPLVSVLVDNEVVNLALKTGAVIKRNDKVAALADLMLGDELLIKTEYDKIVEITAKGAAMQAKGTITAIKLGDVNELVILHTDNTEKTYQVNASTVVMIDGVEKTIYDLRANYSVTVQANESLLTLVKAVSSVSKSSAMGVIEAIYSDLGAIQVKVGESSVTVNTNAQTLCLDMAGAKTTLAKLEKGQTVFVYGKLEENIIIAEKLLRLE